MQIYFLTFRVVPTEKNEHFSMIKGALARFWVLEKSSENAQSRAEYYLGQYQWEIEALEDPPIECEREQFSPSERSQGYDKAQRFGIALVLKSWRKHPDPDNLIEIHQL